MRGYDDKRSEIAIPGAEKQKLLEEARERLSKKNPSETVAASKDVLTELRNLSWQ